MEHCKFTGADVIFDTSKAESYRRFPFKILCISSFPFHFSVASPRHTLARLKISKNIERFYLLRLLAVNNRFICFVSVVSSFSTRKRLT
jgi:hypothetical protein